MLDMCVLDWKDDEVFSTSEEITLEKNLTFATLDSPEAFATLGKTVEPA